MSINQNINYLTGPERLVPVRSWGRQWVPRTSAGSRRPCSLSTVPYIGGNRQGRTIFKPARNQVPWSPSRPALREY